MKLVSCSLAIVAFVVACKEDSSGKPLDVAAWRKTNGAEVEAFRGRLDAAVKLVKDLPAQSVHVADPEVPLMFERDTSPAYESTRLFSGVELRGMPEYGRDQGKSVDSGDQSISLNYWSATILDLDELYAFLAGKQPQQQLTNQMGDDRIGQIRAIRYVLIAQEVSYTPGVIDAPNHTFTSGTYKAVVHLVDLQGPKHLGSVAVSAKNTGKLESYSGSEKFMLRVDLQGEAMEAFRMEWPKVFPKNPLPAPRR